MNSKVALIPGITGQDGAYLAEFLLSKNYQFHVIELRFYKYLNQSKANSQ